ncbi:acetyl-CoA carboxylase biotin carboxylase subunit [Cocleimonas flava]|uniref:Biotin carboxylase n=1 Tax=Cocleimonas flava TaxID=634765 RepID=A0A4R1EY74_9GAMM|nr:MULTISPECIES: acetyl-CoA carboxylase biotin carboxylase subunit [Cocleimonas]MEB8433357.1 acetyl-CoA carboxylase biotin carboxylase subunit [Cocleimonas sp. KMM 6892]MEC4716168.1 acetyl-CoA carboxylase biotin carboxylase subunit [Cocleimonas sp. KMM 6895]MEC4745939.1 acetyl-CoA carboxylase biotin carboxylase subunit [Cocleimonas sp. KMM 6896]TCJ85012.1 acetyl-CoA carboxylase biotin carboxylase subunit [Cocleimonas flava]
MSINKLLIANRGEIAVRICRAAQELGIKTVQVYSDADEDSLAVKIADETVNIGPASASKSYLNMEVILQAAKEVDADAVHPGYGFFSENAEFAEAVTNAGMIFVGPSGETIRQMGDKISARYAADKAGVPTVPGSKGLLSDFAEAKDVADQYGFPLMVKATAGGGGRGIRIVENIEELERAIAEASTEAKAAFGNGGLYIEKYIETGRHVEVQLLGDGTDVVHFFERECSLQRRRQKVWEEAPAFLLTESVRNKLCESAVSLAKSVNYKGAGTVEFLYDETSEDFFFIEMNTRIQVEHPVTEMITGVDLLREMIRVANGEKLRFKQDEIKIKGHAIEVRLNAEDASNNFLPNPGVVSKVHFPGGPGVRMDTHLFANYKISPYYDSLLGKLIVHDEDRLSAIKRLERALSELEIEGVKTTKPLFQALAKDPSVISGDYDTKWLESWLETNSSNLSR